MVQELRRVLGRVEVRVLLLLACGAFLISLAIALAKPAGPDGDVPTVNSWDDLLKRYLLFRDSNYPIVPPV